MSIPAHPAAIYRLQFNADFTFAAAIDIIPYLEALGISHVYASPLLRARAGSAHGYDVVDHNTFNPEIGDAAAFNAYVEVLHRHGMGQILDTVPNHMDVSSAENDWWMDVLEHGEASPYAAFFDIDWLPVKQELRHKVLLPVLGDHYGTVLDDGELELRFDRDGGRLQVAYYGHRFPIDPATYPQVLGRNLPGLQRQLGGDSATPTELAAVVADLNRLPPRRSAAIDNRREAAAVCQRRLAALCQRDPRVVDFIENTIGQFNASVKSADAPWLLHELLEQQAFRLAYWRTAADEINYRRFFDVNELAGIRMENPAVFGATHRLIRRLIGSGAVNGLRLDHPDGLCDPQAYCADLQETLAAARGVDGDDPVYLVVEKILASHEHLPSDWPVAGTTGYEMAHLLNGLLVDPAGERALTRIYHRFIGHAVDFEEILYERKKLVIFGVLSSELTVLANLLDDIAQTDRHTRDFTYHRLREALAEIVACFPVYRTYITASQLSEQDRRYLKWALSQAKKRSRAADISVFDFIHRLLARDVDADYPADVAHAVVQFIARFQQYTAPVMAKGMEDTSFYVYNRLVSLNDVGFSPTMFGITPAAFHHAVRQRRQHWPLAMVSTSTHDSKRSEDVRARIDVLSEMPEEWRRHLGRWRRLNRAKRRLVVDGRAPSRNDEYLIYQTLLGVWPPDEGPLDGLGARLEQYLLKAVREAKVHTSWINPNEEYEEAVRHFIGALLRRPARNAFVADFTPFAHRVARFGLLNSLSQTLWKLTLPGVPDIYQGNEVCTFSLVDPDNRRAVDYRARRALLAELQQAAQHHAGLPRLLRGLLDGLADGRAKLYLTWRALRLRRELPELFLQGDYQGLAAEGGRAEHLCAFARRHGQRCIISAVPRWYCRLERASDGSDDPAVVWGDTRIVLPEDAPRHYRDVLSGARLVAEPLDDEQTLPASTLLAHWPVALLVDEQE